MFRRTRSTSKETKGHSRSTDDTTRTTNPTFGTRRNRNVFVVMVLLGLTTYSLFSNPYHNMLVYVPDSASQQKQMNEDVMAMVKEDTEQLNAIGSKHSQNTAMKPLLDALDGNENVTTTDTTSHPLARQNQTTITTTTTTSHPVARQNQTTITTNVTATDMATTPRPCRVAVTNSCDVCHFETLESIASLFPLDALKFALPQRHEQQCDPQNIQFDYYVTAPESSSRAKEWSESFKKRLEGTQVIIPQKDNVTRRFGELYTQNHTIKELSRSKYLFDATIEATCYCQQSRVEWLSAETRSCVFHERCDKVVKNPRAVWLSPHHKKYYIPTVLPGALQSQQHQQKRPLQNANTNSPHKLCVIGSTTRRNWGFLKGYLESTLGARAAASSRFIIQIVGGGPFPQELNGRHRNMTIALSLPHDNIFYRAASQCEAVLMLISKKSQPHYFDTAESQLKLTGAIPIVIAYQLPLVIHEELYDLYQDRLSSLIHATHSDDATSFNAAMNQLLDALDGNENNTNSTTL